MKENQVNVNLESSDYLFITMFENHLGTKKEFIENCKEVIKIYDYLNAHNLEQEFFEYIEAVIGLAYEQEHEQNGSRLSYLQDKKMILSERIADQIEESSN